MKTTFNENNHIFRLKISDKRHCFTVLQIFLISDLIKVSSILISVLAFNLLEFLVLIESKEQNSASHRYVVGKGRML